MRIKMEDQTIGGATQDIAIAGGGTLLAIMTSQPFLTFLTVVFVVLKIIIIMPHVIERFKQLWRWCKGEKVDVGKSDDDTEI